MPFKDISERREFDRLRKRRARAFQKATAALREVRLYFSIRYPNLHIQGVGSFHQGFLVTRNPEDQNAVEQHPEFWHTIFPLSLDYDRLPMEVDDLF